MSLLVVGEIEKRGIAGCLTLVSTEGLWVAERFKCCFVQPGNLKSLLVYWSRGGDWEWGRMPEMPSFLFFIYFFFSVDDIYLFIYLFIFMYETIGFCVCVVFFFNFILFFKLYIIVLVLPNIKMNPPQVHMCSPSCTLLPPPSPYYPSGSSHLHLPTQVSIS